MSADYYTVSETLKRRGFGRILRKVYASKSYLLGSQVRRCLCCGRPTLIITMDATGEAQRCLRCGANLRYELLADFIRAKYADLGHLDVMEVDPSSPLRPILGKARSYTRTFWSDNIKPGTFRNDGARCEDLTALTFADASFDLMVSSEVLEHVENTALALNEVKRVLRPGGVHIFTVPVAENAPTVERARRKADGSILHLVEPEYHGDPEGSGDGILAFWTFGTDAMARLSLPGLDTQVGLERRDRKGKLLRKVLISRRTE